MIIQIDPMKWKLTWMFLACHIASLPLSSGASTERKSRRYANEDQVEHLVRDVVDLIGHQPLFVATHVVEQCALSGPDGITRLLRGVAPSDKACRTLVLLDSLSNIINVPALVAKAKQRLLERVSDQGEESLSKPRAISPRWFFLVDAEKAIPEDLSNEALRMEGWFPFTFVGSKNAGKPLDHSIQLICSASQDQLNDGKVYCHREKSVLPDASNKVNTMGAKNSVNAPAGRQREILPDLIGQKSLFYQSPLFKNPNMYDSKETVNRNDYYPRMVEEEPVDGNLFPQLSLGVTKSNLEKDPKGEWKMSLLNLYRDIKSTEASDVALGDKETGEKSTSVLPDK